MGRLGSPFLSDFPRSLASGITRASFWVQRRELRHLREARVSRVWRWERNAVWGGVLAGVAVMGLVSPAVRSHMVT